MPNGGSDCCAHCTHNLATQKYGPFRDSKSDSWRYDWLMDSECGLRHIRVPYTHRTFCANFKSWRFEAEPEPVLGPIFSLGHSEAGVTYPRIPWHGDHQPFLNQITGECAVCSREIVPAVGVVSDKGDLLKFCCNAHYMRWWFSANPSEELPYDYRQLRDPDTV